MFKFIIFHYMIYASVSFSAVQNFVDKYNPIIPEMHDLANDSKFGESSTSRCYRGLNEYLNLMNGFTELVRLVSLVNSTRQTRLFGELHNISVAVEDFLFRLHNFRVSQIFNSLPNKKILLREFSTFFCYFGLTLYLNLYGVGTASFIGQFNKRFNSFFISQHLISCHVYTIFG